MGLGQHIRDNTHFRLFGRQHRGLYSSPGCQDVLSDVNTNTDFFLNVEIAYFLSEKKDQIQSNAGALVHFKGHVLAYNKVKSPQVCYFFHSMEVMKLIIFTVSLIMPALIIEMARCQHMYVSGTHSIRCCTWSSLYF